MVKEEEAEEEEGSEESGTEREEGSSEGRRRVGTGEEQTEFGHMDTHAQQTWQLMQIPN